MSIFSDRDFDLRNTWQIVAGAILLPLGMVVILLGWYGAAHARVVQQQIPYLVSGSFIGLGFMTAGGLLFWAHWLYRIYDQANLHHRELLDAINGLGSSGTTTQASAAAAAPARTARATASRFVATQSGSNFHLPSCAVVSGRSGTRAVTAKQASTMVACRLCDPLGPEGQS